VTAAAMTNGSERSRRRCAGFTLTELLVVLVIIGLLAAVAAPTVYQRVQPAKRTMVHTQIQGFASALDSYYVDVGEYPTTAQGLSSLTRPPAGVRGWKGPYLRRGLPRDPWGNPYIYRTPGGFGPYEIISFGADGREGGQDDDRDIISWESEQ
jgi:general secretion pathway protein G